MYNVNFNTHTNNYKNTHTVTKQFATFADAFAYANTLKAYVEALYNVESDFDEFAADEQYVEFYVSDELELQIAVKQA